MNKKGFEFSIGMIVGLILTVLIFSLSIYFMFKWFGQATELKAEIDKQTREQILTALKSGNQLVAIPIAIEEVKRGNPATYGVGVRNIGTEDKYSMAIDYSGAYTPDGKTIPVDLQHIKEKWIGSFGIIDTFILKKNEEKLIPVLIMANVNTAPGTTTPKGDYVFNVCVYKAPLRADGTPVAPCNVQQFNLNSDVFYTNKIYQVVVRVN